MNSQTCLYRQRIQHNINICWNVGRKGLEYETILYLMKVVRNPISASLAKECISLINGVNKFLLSFNIYLIIYLFHHFFFI